MHAACVTHAILIRLFLIVLSDFHLFINIFIFY